LAVPALPFTVTGGGSAVSPDEALDVRGVRPSRRLLAFVSSPVLLMRSGRSGGSCLAARLPVPPSSPGIRPSGSPPPTSCGRPLRDPFRDPSGRGSHAAASRSVHVVSHHLDGFLRTAGPERVAARFRTWGSLGFAGSLRPLLPRERRRTRAGSSPARSYPSKASPRRQPCRIAAVLASLPFVAPLPDDADPKAGATLERSLRSVPMHPTGVEYIEQDTVDRVGSGHALACPASRVAAGPLHSAPSRAFPPGSLPNGGIESPSPSLEPTTGPWSPCRTARRSEERRAPRWTSPRSPCPDPRGSDRETPSLDRPALSRGTSRGGSSAPTARPQARDRSRRHPVPRRVLDERGSRPAGSEAFLHRRVRSAVHRCRRTTIVSFHGLGSPPRPCRPSAGFRGLPRTRSLLVSAHGRSRTWDGGVCPSGTPQPFPAAGLQGCVTSKNGFDPRVAALPEGVFHRSETARPQTPQSINSVVSADK